MTKFSHWILGVVQHYSGAMVRLSIYLLIACVGQSIAELAAMTQEQIEAMTSVQIYVLCAKIIMPGLMVVRAFIDSSMSDARAKSADAKTKTGNTMPPFQATSGTNVS